jgi:hypothetical protein
MNEDSTGTAALVDLWRELRGRTFATAVGTSVGTSDAVRVSDSVQVQLDDVRASVTRPPTGKANLEGLAVHAALQWLLVVFVAQSYRRPARAPWRLAAFTRSP